MAFHPYKDIAEKSFKDMKDVSDPHGNRYCMYDNEDEVSSKQGLLRLLDDFAPKSQFSQSQLSKLPLQ